MRFGLRGLLRVNEEITGKSTLCLRVTEAVAAPFESLPFKALSSTARVMDRCDSLPPGTRFVRPFTGYHEKKNIVMIQTMVCGYHKKRKIILYSVRYAVYIRL